MGVLIAAGSLALGRVHGAADAGLGASSCAASGCHGGASEHSRQYVVWSTSDVHSRSYATLTSSRAERMAEALAIKDPTSSTRCTVCHAPLAAVEPAERGPGVEASEGVSCVSCHGLPGSWLRSHTRPDWSHSQRVGAGMRDLRDLYGRANACVACHQNIDPALVGTGRHPALAFELDGQARDEPKHWGEGPGYSGAQAWFVGQAVALRETSWALLSSGADPAHAAPEVEGLGWVLSRSGLDALGTVPDAAGPPAAALASAVKSADQLAKRAAQSWEPGFGLLALARLSATRDEFLDPARPPRDLAYRAERLVVALDRLLPSVADAGRRAGASASLDRLFQLVQSRDDFSPRAFALELEAFQRALGPVVPAR